MDKDTDTWKKWLATIPADQVEHLKKVLQNGHSKKTEEAKTPIRRMPAESLLVETCPPFVDIYSLTELYGHLAFKSNIIVKGPKGDGKSLSIAHYAHKHTIPRVIIPCSETTKRTDLIGCFTMEGMNTFFMLGLIPTAIDVANETGNCILQFEEINALTPAIQKMLNTLLDFQRFIAIPEIGKVYRLNPGAKLWVVATMNSSVYGGTYDLNEDLRSRLGEIEIDYPPHAQEKRILKEIFQATIPEDIIDKALRLAAETRQKTLNYKLSTRDLVYFLETYLFVGVDASLQMLCCKFEGEDRATIIPRIQAVFGKTPKKTWGAIQ